jgi:hypothetical protein
MEGSFRIEIAGLHLTFYSSQAILPPEPQAYYQPFLKTHRSRTQAIEVPVYLQRGDMPDLARSTKLFDSGSWSIGFEGKDLFLTLHAGSHSERPLCVAKFDRTVSKVMVYCSERLVKKISGKARLINPFSYPLDQILLMYALAREQGVILHAAGVKSGGKGLLLAGRSGSGKSTLSRLLSIDKEVELLNDDRMIVRKMKGGFRAYGTPWPGELRVAKNKRVALCGIFFIHPGSTHRIQKIEPRDALEKLLPVTSIPWYDRTLVPSLLSLCENLVSRVPTYDLYFKRDPNVGTVLKRFISA